MTSHAPAVYNDITLKVDPRALMHASYLVNELAKEISEAADKIEATMTRLRGLWQGAAAVEAEAALAEINAAFRLLFGAGGDGGAIAEVAKGLVTAAQNFTNAELAVTQRFRAFLGDQAPPAFAPPPGPGTQNEAVAAVHNYDPTTAGRGLGPA